MALQAAKLGTWVRDMKTGGIEWSSELCEIFGLTSEATPKTPEVFFEFIHPDDRELVTNAIRTVIQDGGGYCVDFRYKHSSGEYRWMNGRGRGFYGSEGELLELVGTGLDITERKNEERLRQERESQRSQIGDNLPDGAIYQFLIPKEGERKYIYWSAGIERLIGVSAEEALADPKLLSLILPEHLPVVTEAEKRSIKERCPFNVIVQMRHAKTGEWRWVHWRSALRILPNGDAIWDGIYLDVTRQKIVEQNLIWSQERLELAQRAGNIGVFDWDIQTGSLVWSEEEKRIFGVSDESFNGSFEDWRRYVIPEDRGRVEAEWKAVMQRKEQDMGFRFRIIRPDGALA